MVSHPKTLSAELYRFPPARAARRSKTHEAYSNRSPLSLWSKHQKIRFHKFQLFEPVHPLSVHRELVEGRGGRKGCPEPHRREVGVGTIGTTGTFGTVV